MTFSYSKIFTIELLHEYFLSGKCTDLQIVPAEDCRIIAKSMGMLFRNIDNGLAALIKDNENGEPFINNASNAFFRTYYNNTVLRFYVTIANAQFLNYTNIEFSSRLNKKFYFSNLSQNAENDFLYLTLPVEDFATGTAYLPGDLVNNPANGNIFESLKKNTPKKKADITDAQLWAPKGLFFLPRAVEDFKTGKFYQPGDLVKNPTGNVYEAKTKHAAGNKSELDDVSVWAVRGQGQLEYVTGQDLVEYSNGRYVFQLADPVTDAEISFLGFNYNADKPAYDKQLGSPQKMKFNDPVSQISVDLSALSPGRYAVKINKEIKMVYYDPSMPGDALGVIEIFNHLPGKDIFSLLTDEEKIKNVQYHIQFCTRRVLWKYITKDSKAKSISDSGDTAYVFNLNDAAFVSAIPIPLSEKALKTLKLEFSTKDFVMSPLPNPGVQRLGKFTQNDYDYFCSEVYLNY